jgi:hypothetical protein
MDVNKRIAMKASKIVSIVIIASVALSVVSTPALGQSTPPVNPPVPMPPITQGSQMQPVQVAPDKWFMPVNEAQQQTSEAMSPQAVTNNPDDFGYSWSIVPMTWIDAVAGGTDSGLAGGIGQTGPIPLPFAFKYYENTYTSLFINVKGFVRFSSGWETDRPSNLPSPAEPNNIIVPLSLYDLFLQQDGTNGRIYYKAGGSAPNRYFVVQWNNVLGGSPNDPIGRDDVYQFQVVIQENGDIRLQYASMISQGGYWCPDSVGIEDATGRDGFNVLNVCDIPGINFAYQITRPAPAARMRVIEQFDGSHAAPGMMNDYPIQVANTGDLGADTFEVIASAPAFGSASIYAADGITVLKDSNANGTADTGSLKKGQAKTIIVRTETGSISQHEAGDYNITFRSALNNAIQRQSIIRQSSPMRFAQVFVDGYKTIKLYLAHPAGQKSSVIATVDNAFDPAVAEMTNGHFLIVWRQGRCLGGNCSPYVNELYYAVADKHGQVVKGATQLTNLSNVTNYTYDQSPKLIVAPNGQAGVVWMRNVYRQSDFRIQRNAFLTVLDAAGNITRASVPVTNYEFSGYSDIGSSIMDFSGPGAAATIANRFIIAWAEEKRTGPQGECGLKSA